jgi:hypothetical protein
MKHLFLVVAEMDGDGSISFDLDHDTLDALLGGVMLNERTNTYGAVPDHLQYADEVIRERIIKALDI